MLRQILLAPHVSTYIFGTTFSVYIIGITFYGLYYIIGIISYGLYYWYHLYGVHYWHHMSQHYYWHYFSNEYYWHYMLWTILYYWYYILWTILLHHILYIIIPQVQNQGKKNFSYMLILQLQRLTIIHLL